MAVINLGNNNDLWEAFQNGNAFESNTINANGGDDLIVSGLMDDIVNGGAGNDTLFGIGGNDTLNGGEGNDSLDGGNGNDNLNGGTGVDTYFLEFPTAETGKDIITDVDGTGIIEIGSTQFDPNTGQTTPIGYTLTGNPVLKSGSTNIYTLTIGADTYNFRWSGVNGSDLTFWNAAVPESQVSAVIKNFNNGSFGLILGEANTAPSAANDIASLVENKSVVIDILKNDTDSDGTIDLTSVKITQQPTNGKITIDATTGKVTYTPNANYVGSDSFKYTVQDNDGEVSNVATVSITVTDSAITLTENADFFEAFSQGLGNANNEIYGLGGNDVIISGNGNDIIDGGNGNDIIFGVNGNDTIKGGAGNDTIDSASGTNIAEGGAGLDTYLVEFTDAGSTRIKDDTGSIFVGNLNQQTFALEGFALAGTGTKQSDGSYKLIVNSNTYKLVWNSTTKDLSVTQTSGTGNNHSVIIENFSNNTYGISLEEAANTPPVANDDNIKQNVNANGDIVYNVAANDTDSDGTLYLPGGITITSQPKFGTVLTDVNGNIFYRPSSKEVGSDTFKYTITDNRGGVSNEGTVTITIDDGAIRLTDTADFFEAFSIGKGNTNNTIYAKDGNDIIISGNGNDNVYGGAGNDTVFAVNGNDNVYGGEGNDVIEGGSGTNVLRGDGGSDTFVVDFSKNGSTEIIDTTGKIISGAISQQTLQPIGTELKGTAKQLDGRDYFLTIGNDTYKLVYNPATEVEMVITKVGDSNPHSIIIKDFESGMYGITLQANSAPIARSDSGGDIKLGETVVIDILANDNDPDGKLDYSSVIFTTQPKYGTFTYDPITGKLTYTANSDIDSSFAREIFSYTVKDENGKVSDSTSISISITDPNAVEDFQLTSGNDVWDSAKEGYKYKAVIINSLDGNDQIVSGNENDEINAGNGNDYVNGSWGNDTIYGGNGLDKLLGSYGNDTIYGEAGNDIIDGGHGNDILKGGEGNDKIFGSYGDDFIFGGAGNDILKGGFGADVFVFEKSVSIGSDVIKDFTLGTDKISLIGFTAADFDIVTSGKNSIIDFGANEILIENAIVTDSDFIFTA